MSMQNTKAELIKMISNLKEDGARFPFTEEYDEMKWKIKSLEGTIVNREFTITQQNEMEEKLTSSIKLFQKERKERKAHIVQLEKYITPPILRIIQLN